ncbi:MAG: acyltransferase family protein [Nocardioidaceae bacterium]
MATPTDTVTTVPQRALWVDNLRVIVIACVIVVHTATAYVIDIPWYYEAERTASETWMVILGFPTFAGGIFGLGPLFLVAGWFSVRSLARRGAGGFARSRLLRLGVPLLVFVLLVQPLTDWVGNLRSEHGSFLHYLSITEVSVMWYVAALLAFSLVYAAVRRLRPAAEARRAELTTGRLVLAAATIAVTSFAVWQVWPFNAEVFLNLRFGEWPQGAVLFGLGVWAAEAGWLDDLAWARARRLGWVAAAAAVLLGSLFGLEIIARGDVDVLLQATQPAPTAAFALLDGVIAVTWTLWCVAWFRRRWTRHGPLLGEAARASYATYVFHPLVLTSIMVLLAPVVLVAELKFVLISVVAVPACFLVGYALTRLPGVSRVL